MCIYKYINLCFEGWDLEEEKKGFISIKEWNNRDAFQYETMSKIQKEKRKLRMIKIRIRVN